LSSNTIQLEPDLNEGTQPADFNAIGVSASRFPAKKLAFFLAIITVILVVAFFLIKNWVAGALQNGPLKTQKTDQSPALTQAPQASRPKLPDANTPLEGNAAWSDPAPTPKSPASSACPATTLLDKRSGKPVKDAQGQSVMVDCNGIIQSGARIPAPAATQNTVPAINAGASTPADRYAGDTALSQKKSPGSSLASPPLIAPPPVSAAALEAQLTRLMTPAASATKNNSILSGNSSSPTTPPNPQGSMGGLLSPTSTPKAMALRTFDPSLTIPKGDAINCAMTTRVVTEISGFTSCIVSENVYSANGKVLLIERMSEIQGEYTAVGQPGQRRVYVLWSRVRKPGGITIDIASPSTDTLGAAGIDGIVDNRWFERIGSAYMLSIFKDFLAANAASTAGGAAGVNTATGSALFQNSISTSNTLAEKVLSQSINIKPVVYAHQGERISIYVARDLDFSGIYQVKPASNQP